MPGFEDKAAGMQGVENCVVDPLDESAVADGGQILRGDIDGVRAYKQGRRVNRTSRAQNHQPGRNRES